MRDHPPLPRALLDDYKPVDVARIVVFVGTNANRDFFSIHIGNAAPPLVMSRRYAEEVRDQLIAELARPAPPKER